jgi:FkbM family methyltransferase
MYLSYDFTQMLIGFDEINTILKQYGIQVGGAFHIGAHDCEEMGFYGQLGLSPEKVVWIDAIDSKVLEARKRGIPNVYCTVVTDQDDQPVVFNISNNGQSSSVLELGTHAREYPGIVYVQRVKKTSVTIDTFFSRNGLDSSKYDFWNFDIQGAELMALRGAETAIKTAKAIYLEVNINELYVGCGRIEEVDAFLLERGFRRMLTRVVSQGWGDALYIRG